MNYRQLLEELCKDLEENLNYSDRTVRKHKVEFNTGTGHWRDRNRVFTARIDVDNVCIFKDTAYYKDEIDLPELEEQCYRRMLSSVFNYGVMSSKRAGEEFIKANPFL